MKITPQSVWYLAHPVAPDERFSYEENLDHVLKMAKICYEEGFRVYVPWHTLCLILPDSDPENRRIGLEVDCELVRLTGRLIMVGHKVSSGMQKELEALKSLPDWFLVDCTGKPDRMVREQLQSLKKNYLDIIGIAK